MLLAMNVDKQALLSMIDPVINNLFHNPTDAFFTGRVMDLLFDGISLDCSGDDEFTVGVCSTMENEKPFRRIDDGHLAFSMFGGVSIQFESLSTIERCKIKENFI